MLQRADIHRTAYLLLLALLGASMTTSVWLANLAWGALGANWVLEGRWAEKWQLARRSRLLQGFAVLWGLLLLGMAWTGDLGTGLGVLQVSLPLVVVPLVALTSRPVEGWWRTALLALYSATVVVVSVVAAVRLFSIEGLPYREAVPHISHIRFSLNCCVVIVLCVRCLLHGGPWQRLVSAAVAVWLLAVLVMLRSYTGLIVLGVAPMAVLLLCWRRLDRKVRRRAAAVWLCAVTAALAVVAFEVHSYYAPNELSRQPRRELTEDGHPYSHDPVGVVENGGHVYDYICYEELAPAWAERSRAGLDDTLANGYPLQAVLIRYLNAVGLTKDAAGIRALTDRQVAEIEQGIENPVYIHGNSLKRMVYVMCFEYECGRHDGAIRDFTMLQRFELWRHAWRAFSRRPLLGSGTGDVVSDLSAELVRDNSPLSPWPHKAHNQYLTLLLSFGLLGFVLLLLAFARALPDLRRQPAWMLFWVVAVLLSFLTEDTFDTLAGILFCTYFLPFRKL